MYYTFKILLLSISILITEYTLINTISTKAKIINTDYFEQLYIGKHNTLEKYNPNGILLSSYSNQSNGEISAIDVSDPYILLLFYEDLNRVIFLDDKLAPIGKPLDLDKLDLFNVSVVCKSKSFAIWIYDRFDNRLIHYGFNPKGIIQEIMLDPLKLEHEVIFMIESGNHLYLNTGKQVIVLDQYGSFIKSIDSEIKKTLQIKNNQIIYFKDNKLLMESIQEPNTDTLEIDFIQGIKHVLIENNRLFVQKADSVFIYEKTD